MDDFPTKEKILKEVQEVEKIDSNDFPFKEETTSQLPELEKAPPPPPPPPVNPEPKVKTKNFSSLFENLESSNEHIEIASTDVTGHFLDDEKTENSNSQASNVPNGKMTGKSAELYVFTFDIFLSKMSAAIGMDIENEKKYRLSEEDRKTYIRVSEAYFDTVDVKLNPTSLFVLLTLLFSATSLFSAVGKRREKMKFKKRKEERKKLEKELKESGAGAIKTSNSLKVEIDADNEEDEEEKRERLLKRRKFDIDKSTGMYTYDLNGKYIKKSDRVEVAPIDIRTMLEDGKTNGDIIKFLKG